MSDIGPILDDLDRALDRFGEQTSNVTGTLRINASDTAARILMQQAVPTFLARHARAGIELNVERGFVDIIKRGFDAGVRFARSVPQDMIAVPFGEPVRFVTVAAPSYLEQHGRPMAPEDLMRHQCIRQRMPSGRIYRWDFCKDGDDFAVDVPGALMLNHNELMVEAAVASLGIAYLPENSARAMMDARKLTVVLDDWSPEPSRLCLYYAGHRYVPAGLRAFIDILRHSSR